MASPEIIAAVADANLKTIAEAGAQAMATIFQDQAAHRARLNILAESYLAAACRRANELDAEEAVSIQKTLTGNDLGQVLAGLNAAIAAAQQVVKAATTTPPVTK